MNIWCYCMTFALCALEVRGHGRLLEPPSRASMWRFGFDSPPNYNDNQQFCGGFYRQWTTNGGKCGVCGDPWDGKRDHEAGGKYARGIITKNYTESATIDVEVQVTASHLGYFEFRLCPHNNPKTPVTQECLDQHLLHQLNGQTRVKEAGHAKTYAIQLVLPAGVTCTQCLLQWKWNTGNSYGCERKRCCKGCGEQEQFYGCSDIGILPRSFQSQTGSAVVGQTGNQVEGQNGYQVEGHHGSHVEGQNGNQVEGQNGNQVEGHHGSHVEGQNGNQVEGQNGSQVEGQNGSQVEGKNGSQVEGHTGNNVESQNGSQVEGHHGSQVEGQNGGQTDHVADKETDNQSQGNIMGVAESQLVNQRPITATTQSYMDGLHQNMIVNSGSKLQSVHGYIPINVGFAHGQHLAGHLLNTLINPKPHPLHQIPGNSHQNHHGSQKPVGHLIGPQLQSVHGFIPINARPLNGNHPNGHLPHQAANTKPDQMQHGHPQNMHHALPHNGVHSVYGYLPINVGNPSVLGHLNSGVDRPRPDSDHQSVQQHSLGGQQMHQSNHHSDRPQGTHIQHPEGYRPQNIAAGSLPYLRPNPPQHTLSSQQHHQQLLSHHAHSASGLNTAVSHVPDTASSGHMYVNGNMNVQSVHGFLPINVRPDLQNVKHK